jgi:glycosyltransferase involved in cell wall biosynthesis
VALRQAFGLPPDCVLVGWFGRLTHWKGAHVLVEAARQVLVRRHQLYFLIVGSAIYETREYEQSLRSAVAAAALQDRVIFTGYRRDPLALMAGLDVLTHTSVLPDPLPTVLIEGAYLRKAMIATRGGGVAEMVTDGEQALLVEPNNPDALAAAINRLLADPTLRERLGRAARKRAECLFDLEHYIQTLSAGLKHAAQPSAA